VSYSNIYCSTSYNPNNLIVSNLYFLFSGIIKQQKKKSQPVKEGKKAHPHIQTGPAQAGIQSQAVGPQSSSQINQHQPSSAGFMAPPPVAALESSQLLETSFESLPPFGQPLMHMSHHTGNSTSPVPPHLNAHSAGPVSPETHPFLNQHPVLPSPGKGVRRCSVFEKSNIYFHCIRPCDCSLFYTCSSVPVQFQTLSWTACANMTLHFTFSSFASRITLHFLIKICHIKHLLLFYCCAL